MDGNDPNLRTASAKGSEEAHHAEEDLKPCQSDQGQRGAPERDGTVLAQAVHDNHGSIAAGGLVVATTTNP